MTNGQMDRTINRWTYIIIDEWMDEWTDAYKRITIMLLFVKFYLENESTNKELIEQGKIINNK